MHGRDLSVIRNGTDIMTAKTVSAFEDRKSAMERREYIEEMFRYKYAKKNSTK